MGTTGLIFSAIAIAWLAYLVPHFARHRGEDLGDDADPANRFSDSVRILREGKAPLLDQDLAEIGSHEVSTPLTRRAAIAELQRLESVAAKRRRRVLIGLLAALTAALVGHLVGGPWWVPVVPAALLVAFVVVARLSVRLMRRRLDLRYSQICAGSQEATVVLTRRDVTVAQRGRGPAVPETATKPGVLWDPVPITVPTYVSKPLAPRTVRTIDLSGPGVTPAEHAVPVVADAPAAPMTADRPSRGDQRPEAASA